MADSIAQLTSRVRAGDSDAFRVFYETWFDVLYAEARRTTGRDESFCLDVVQEAMLRVIKSIPTIETETALEGWLRVTVRSCVCDRLRQDTRRRRREESVPAREAVADRDDLREHEAWLRRELRTLDTPTWTLLMMRHRFGWPLARIARALGMSVGAVDGRLRRIRAGLGRRAEEDLHV